MEVDEALQAQHPQPLVPMIVCHIPHYALLRHKYIENTVEVSMIMRTRIPRKGVTKRELQSTVGLEERHSTYSSSGGWHLLPQSCRIRPELPNVYVGLLDGCCCRKNLLVNLRAWFAPGRIRSSLALYSGATRTLSWIPQPLSNVLAISCRVKDDGSPRWFEVTRVV